MTWNSCLKLNRLKAALRMRDIDPSAINIDELARVLARRGITDRQQNDIIWELINTLEPPACPMTHCKNYGGQSSPMNCAVKKIPGHCKTLKDYRQRQKARQDKRGKGK